MIKNFSITEKKGTFNLTLLCLSPHGKEKIVKLYLSFPTLEQLAISLQKVIDEQKKKLPKEKDISYIT
ncbi:MAG: hypothetical protein NZ942_00645 [Candidatus Aenigmarchaeota archaeon]|nr:hypothetical protein [Candidatus Aenigmarchaeota archaeon]